MAITFRCKCGQGLQAGDEHAGKQIVCPHCGESMAIPFPEKRESLCPACGKPMDDDVVVCMECGFNRKTGRRLVTETGRPAGKVPRDKEEIAEKPPLLSSFSQSFAFPLRGVALAMVISIPVLRALSVFVPFGSIIYFALFYSFLIDIMRTAAGGPTFRVEWPDFSDFWSEMLAPALIVFFVALIVIGIPIGTTVLFISRGIDFSHLNGLSGLGTQILSAVTGGSIVIIIVTIVCAGYFPMSLTIAGIYQGFAASLNPVVLFRSISRIPKEYILVSLFVYTVLALSVFIGLALLQVPFGIFLLPMVSFYFWAVAASRLGSMAYYNKSRMGW